MAGHNGVASSEMTPPSGGDDAAQHSRRKGKQPFEIQDLCFKYITEQFMSTPEQYIKVRKCAYEKGFPVRLILDVLAIELRDQLRSG